MENDSDGKMWGGGLGKLTGLRIRTGVRVGIRILFLKIVSSLDIQFNISLKSLCQIYRLLKLQKLSVNCIRTGSRLFRSVGPKSGFSLRLDLDPFFITGWIRIMINSLIPVPITSIIDLTLLYDMYKKF